MIEPTIPTIFLSYAAPDRARVIPCFDYLRSKGLNVWMDCKCLKPGQNWDLEIRRVLDTADFILIFVSRDSVDRRGYAQREIKIALDNADEKLVGDIYIIPVLLDQGVTIPSQLKEIHCVKAWEEDAYSVIEDAINHQLRVAGIESLTAQEKSNISWRRVRHKESWDGCPGYETDIEFLELSSSRYPQVADISNFVRGRLLNFSMDQRSTLFSQMPDFFSFGQNKSFRTNWLDAQCSEPAIRNRIISIAYSIHHYGAGAAHRNLNFRTYSFFLDPAVFIHSLKEIFRDEKAALDVVRPAVRGQLLAASPRSGVSVDKGWVERGTQEWDNFRSFVFRDNDIEFLFPPYQVDCYAAGPKQATISYEHLAGLMRTHYADALGVNYLLR